MDFGLILLLLLLVFVAVVVVHVQVDARGVVQTSVCLTRLSAVCCPPTNVSDTPFCPGPSVDDTGGVLVLVLVLVGGEGKRQEQPKSTACLPIEVPRTTRTARGEEWPRNVSCRLL